MTRRTIGLLLGVGFAFGACDPGGPDASTDPLGEDGQQRGPDGDGGVNGDGANGNGDGANGDGTTPSARNCNVTAAATSTIYYVAANGNDTSGNGSSASPWATITHAVNQASDGSTILVKAGTYDGEARLDRRFDVGIVVRSEQRYAAKLRNAGTVVRSFSGQRITLEGFDIAHTNGSTQPVVMHIQSTNTSQPTNRITIRDNVIHDSYNNDIIKLNNAAEHVTIEGNVFYNQAGSDEHIDANSVKDCVIQDNIFFNDFAGSGRTNGNDTSAYVVVKDSNANSDGVLGAERLQIRRNVFLNWEGSSNFGFLQIGEDGTANFEAKDIIIENNLLLGNSANQMRSPLSAMGVQNVTFRHNTVVGDFPGPSTFGFVARLYNFGSNPPNENIQLWNNVWSDPTGTMNRFSISENGQTASFTLSNNLYWNNGSAIPTRAGDLVNVSSDVAAKTTDPMLGAQGAISLPRLVDTTFNDGSATICQAFERLVTNYGTPATGSSVFGAASALQSVDHDILMRPRGASRALGAAQP